MATQAEIDGWKDRMAAIQQRLLHPKGLNSRERSALDAELKVIERLVQAPPSAGHIG